MCRMLVQPCITNVTSTSRSLLVPCTALAIRRTRFPCQKHWCRGRSVSLVLVVIVLKATAVHAVGFPAPSFQSCAVVQSGKPGTFPTCSLTAWLCVSHENFGTIRLNMSRRKRNDLGFITFVRCCSPRIVLAAFVDIPNLPC